MIALIDYGAGNLRSVCKALELVGGDVVITDSPEQIKNADAVVLPGVGNFGDGMSTLRAKGLEQPILDAVNSGKPFLGICLGMQLLMEGSEEAPDVPGLGVFKGKVIHFPEGSEKVPHMGWNDISVRSEHKCFKDIVSGDFFYFVHSYYVAPDSDDVVVATCSYIHDFAAVIGRDNIFATQFHPEKSQNKGLTILKNFVDSI